MTEQTPETTPEVTTETPAPAEPEVAPAPKDAAEDVATGYAVYDRTLARYVGGVTTDKPSKSDAAKLVAKGHRHAIVRV